MNWARASGRTTAPAAATAAPPPVVVRAMVLLRPGQRDGGRNGHEPHVVHQEGDRADQRLRPRPVEPGAVVRRPQLLRIFAFSALNSASVSTPCALSSPRVFSCSRRSSPPGADGSGGAYCCGGGAYCCGGGADWASWAAHFPSCRCLTRPPTAD